MDYYRVVDQYEAEQLWARSTLPSAVVSVQGKIVTAYLKREISHHTVETCLGHIGADMITYGQNGRFIGFAVRTAAYNDECQERAESKKRMQKLRRRA